MLGDLSEAGYGISLSSSHKYGYAIEGNVMRYVQLMLSLESYQTLKHYSYRMSLLRGPRNPDPTTDKGKHQFSLAIMPHVGYLQDSNTYKQAMAFTNPVYRK
jgi:alpha-mannosidase